MTLQPDRKFAHFKIISKLGEGGMGEVFLAEDLKLNRRVALKILPPEYFDDRDRLDRFTREARTAAKISHANVMGIYDIDSAVEETTGREYSYIVMEYVKGDTLSEYLRAHNLSIADTLKLAEHIASGLAAAHKLGIVHRDIKTDNILVDDEGEPKILDFGLAKPISSAFNSADTGSTQTASQDLTQEGKIIGTVSYMSPEQARGDAVDGRSDIFSFGILLYRMFTGKLPFDGGDRVSTIAKILESRQTPIRQVSESLPPELERIIEKCLQKRPDDRYQDTRDLVVDLRSLRRQYESGISELTSSITGRTGESARVRTLTLGGKRLAGLVIVAVVVAAAVFGIMKRSGSQSTSGLQARENALAVLGFENKTGDPELDWMTAGLPEILVTDLAQGGTQNIISRGRIVDYIGSKSKETNDNPSYQESVQAARALGASRVLSGSFYKMGDKIRIDARLEDIASGKVIMGEKVVGDDPFSLVDSLTHKIASSLNLQGFAPNNADITTYTSSSPEAYKQYILGMEQFGQYNFDSSIAYFQKAIDIDSDFALPYMRIGMAYTFRGRQQQGVPYFAAAARHTEGLPVKERNLLDIYTDIWMRSKLDDAFVKLKTYVGNYPDDKEGRAFYGLFLSQISNQDSLALIQFDSALMIDPRFQLALESAADACEKQENYAGAVDYISRIKQYYPRSSTAYLTLAALYRSMQRYDDAVRECRELLTFDPQNQGALVRLTNISILKTDLDAADQYADQLRKAQDDDPFSLASYNELQASLADWRGRFTRALDYRHKAVDQALKTGDSVQIWNRYTILINNFFHLDMLDSVGTYAERANQYVAGYRGLSYPFILVRIDGANIPRARTIFQNCLNDLRSRLPEQLWPLADASSELFNGMCDADTARMIEAYRSLQSFPGQTDDDETVAFGRLLILTGKPTEGKNVLKKFLSGKDASTDTFIRLQALYYSGRADEALGNTAEAKNNYAEIMRYWGKPDVEIELIRDARQHLARLTS